MYGAYPQKNDVSYLHVIHCVPNYDQLIDLKYDTFDKLLRSKNEFGILTSNKLPHVSYLIKYNFCFITFCIKYTS